MNNKLIQYIADKVAEFAYQKSDNKYLQECVDHFFVDWELNWHYQYIRMPIATRLFPNLISKELIETKPMDSPSGVLFYLDFETYEEYKK